MVCSNSQQKTFEKIGQTCVAILIGLGILGSLVNSAHAQTEKKKIGDVVIRGELQPATSKTHQIKLSASRFYQLAVKRTDATLATELRVQDATGKTLSQSSGVGAAALEFSPPAAGVYQLVVTSTTPGKGGAYALTVKVEAVPGGTRRPPFTATGELRLGGKTLPGNKYYQEYRVALQAGRTYTIRMISNRFDAFLYLKNSTNRTLSANDDGPGLGLNSQITYRCAQSGVYRIYATSLGGNQVGAFTFSVR